MVAAKRDATTDYAQMKASNEDVEDCISVLLKDDTWKERHRGLLLLLEHLKWQEQQQNSNADLNLSRWVDQCTQLLSDKEVRVRVSSGEAIATLCRILGLETYDGKIAEPLLTSIENNMNLERDGQVFLDDDEDTKKLAEKLLAGEMAQQRKKGLSHASRASSIQSTIFHDTAGWGRLESDVACLHQVVEKLGSEFAPRLVSPSDVVDIICSCALHMNRFVRGAAFRAINAIFISLHKADCSPKLGEDEAHVCDRFLLDTVAQSSDLVARLGTGLCDEWANVRMDASTALRTFLVCLQTFQRRQCYFDELLPRMCVNRYYVAAGVSTYSLDTWRQIIGEQGREVVAKWLEKIVPFYIMQTKVANSEARDAAAKCIGELAARIDKSVVSTHAGDLLDALIPRLSHVDAWEVKTSACNSIAELVRAFPDRFNIDANLPQLIPSLSALLADKIVAVRERASMVLGLLASVSDENACGPVLELCVDGLGAAAKETDERGKYGQADLASWKRERANDAALHTDQESIDCCAVGDLDPNDSEQLGILKLSSIYIQAQKINLELGSNKWERTDGCLYLVRELALCGRWKTGGKPSPYVEGVLAALKQVASLRHFIKHLTLLTTLWNVLPEIAQAIGLETFKHHLEAFLEPLAYSMLSEDKLTIAAAKACIAEIQLRCFGGRDSFLEFVQLHNADLVKAFSDIAPPE